MRIQSNCKHTIAAACLITLLITTETLPQNPKLFFTQSQVSELKEEIRLDSSKQLIWNDVRARAFEYCDMSSGYYFDTADVKQSVLKFIKPAQWPILAGRVLSAQCETLGPAYWLAGSSSFGARGKEVFLAYIRQYPLSVALQDNFIALARGELMRGLAQGYDWFSPLMTEGERAEAAAVCRQYIEYELEQALIPSWYVPYSNWTAVAIGGAGMLACAVTDQYPEDSPQWINQCKELINDFFEHSFGIDGDFSEHGYIEYAMVNAALFADAIRSYDGTELFAHPHFINAAKWLVYEMLPGSTVIESRNDTGYPKSDGVYSFAQPWGLRMAKVNNDALASYIWQESKKAVRSDFPYNELKHSSTAGLSVFRILWGNSVAAAAPSADNLPLCKFFSRRGLSIWRTGWAKGDVMFSIESGQPFPVTHDQADAGSFNLYAFGNQWAVDAGYGNLKKPDDRSQGAAHNIVQIDGKSQALTGAGLVTGGSASGYEQTEQYAYVLCDATEGYNYSIKRKDNSFDTEQVASELASGARKVLRHAVYIKPSSDATAYFVLIDDIVQDDNTHSFKWQMLTDSQNTIALSDDAATLSYQNNSLIVSVDAANGGQWSIGGKSFTDGRTPASFKTIEYDTTAVNPYFAAVLIPLKAGATAPKVSFSRNERSLKIIVKWANRADTIIFNYDTAKPRIFISDKLFAWDIFLSIAEQWLMCTDPQISECVKS